MGLKFYRSSNKGRKLRKRFMNTRTFFSTHKWVSYFAHPVNIPGHPFKGGDQVIPKGVLLNPEIKRFALPSPHYFKPPRPDALPGASAAATNYIDSANSLVRAYLGSSAIANRGNCPSYYANLERCFTTSSNAGRDPEEHCQHFVQGLSRNNCTA